jgi:hypothetical protein
MEKSKQIYPFDLREHLLKPEKMITLYSIKWNTDNFRSYFYTINLLYENYIKPFTDYFKVNCGTGHCGLNLENLRNRSDYLFISEYLKELIGNFCYINKIIREHHIDKDEKIIEDIQLRLRYSWLRVTDYWIFRKFVSDDSMNELSVVVGDSHVININDTFKKHNPSNFELIKDNIQYGKKGDCIKLFKTLLFDDSTKTDKILSEVE